MAVEAATSLAAPWMARSPALLAFGGDSLIELLSAVVVLWRFTTPTASEPHREACSTNCGDIAPFAGGLCGIDCCADAAALSRAAAEPFQDLCPCRRGGGHAMAGRGKTKAVGYHGKRGAASGRSGIQFVRLPGVDRAGETARKPLLEYGPRRFDGRPGDYSFHSSRSARSASRQGMCLLLKGSTRRLLRETTQNRAS